MPCAFNTARILNLLFPFPQWENSIAVATAWDDVAMDQGLWPYTEPTQHNSVSVSHYCLLPIYHLPRHSGRLLHYRRPIPSQLG